MFRVWVVFFFLLGVLLDIDSFVCEAAHLFSSICSVVADWLCSLICLHPLYDAQSAWLSAALI